MERVPHCLSWHPGRAWRWGRGTEKGKCLAGTQILGHLVQVPTLLGAITVPHWSWHWQEGEIMGRTQKCLLEPTGFWGRLRARGWSPVGSKGLSASHLCFSPHAYSSLFSSSRVATSAFLFTRRNGGYQQLQIHMSFFQQSTPAKPAISGSSSCSWGNSLLAQLALATVDQPPPLNCGLSPCFRNMACLVVKCFRWGGDSYQRKSNYKRAGRHPGMEAPLTMEAFVQEIPFSNIMGWLFCVCMFQASVSHLDNSGHLWVPPLLLST